VPVCNLKKNVAPNSQLLKLLSIMSLCIGILFLSIHIFPYVISLGCGPGSSVGIATDYGLDDPGSNPGGEEIFRPSRPALGPTQPLVQWVPGLSWGKGGRGVGLSPHPHLVPKVLEKSRTIPLLTLKACVAYKKRENVPVS